MAEDRLAQPASSKAHWTRLFSSFRVALDLRKLVLASGGIVATACGWWILAWLFYSPKAPERKDYAELAADKPVEVRDAAFTQFRIDRNHWRLFHELAAPTPATTLDARKSEVIDHAGSLEEFDALTIIRKLRDEGIPLDVIKKAVEANAAADPAIEQVRKELPSTVVAVKAVASYEKNLEKPKILATARLRSWPWTEERGENPYLLAEGLLRKDAEGAHTVPWDRGEFLTWLANEQLPFLVEPLTKFLAPIAYFFNSNGYWKTQFYLGLVILWTLATWGFFGGAICRIAAVELARNEKIAFSEAIAFTKEKFLNYFTAPLFPLVMLGILTGVLCVFALFHWIPVLGDVLDGVAWIVVLLMGLLMAVIVVGLIGWPLMNPTIAAEGSDNLDALSRSFSYIYQAPWRYFAYWACALGYGAVLIFFVGFMGSMVVYMGKWGMSQMPLTRSADPKWDRDPAYLFYYAPTSFGWRDLLIKDCQYAEPKQVVNAKGVATETYEFKQAYVNSMTWYNHVGAFLVMLWVGALFLMVIGFGYSYFWTASTIIYLLMRQKVDDTEFEEVFFEEQEMAPPHSSVVATQTPVSKPSTISLNLVDPAPSPAPTPAPLAPASPVAAPPAPVSAVSTSASSPLDPNAPSSSPPAGPM